MPSPATTARAFAPAKINLTLHVTGRRADGYHDLDSLVVFADVGDWITAARADETSLTLTGPRAEGVPVDADNLVLRAAALMPDVPAAVTLDKHLPAAAGIGGGSADAAATLRALASLGAPLPSPAELLKLGADVPVCLANRPCRMRGLGDIIAPIPKLPSLHLVLVNPGIAVPTPKVFAALNGAYGPPMPVDLPEWPDAESFASWLNTQRNDLEPPARALAPVIDEVSAAIQSQPGCLLNRMSGSGATCFGVFAKASEAQAAATVISSAYAEWWVAAAPVLP